MTTFPQRPSDPARRGPRPFGGRVWLAALLFLFLLALWSGLAESAPAGMIPRFRAGGPAVESALAVADQRNSPDHIYTTWPRPRRRCVG